MATAKQSKHRVPTLAHSEQARRRAARLYAALLVALLSGNTGASALASELEPKLLSDELYGETFSAVADLSDGTYLLMQLAITNLGPGDGRGICRLLQVVKNGAQFTNGAHYDREEWRHKDGALSVGPCFMKTLGKSFTVRTKVGEGAESGDVLLTFDAVPKAIKPPNHRYTTTDAFYEMEVLIPSADVRAEIEIGGKKRTVSGRGFVTHSRSNELPAKLASRWIRFRALADPKHLLLLRAPAERSAQAKGWAWSTGAPFEIKRLKIQRRQTAKGPLFRVQTVAPKGRWILTAKRMLFRDAPLERYGFIGRLLGSVLGNPVTYTYRATLKTPTRGAIEGIMEVSFPGGE